MGKMTGFRETKKAEDIINKYMNIHHIASRSLAINRIIESFQSELQSISEDDFDKKYEETRRKEDPFYQNWERTKKTLKCDIRNVKVGTRIQVEDLCHQCWSRFHNDYVKCRGKKTLF